MAVRGVAASSSIKAGAGNSQQGRGRKRAPPAEPLARSGPDSTIIRRARFNGTARDHQSIPKGWRGCRRTGRRRGGRRCGFRQRRPRTTTGWRGACVLHHRRWQDMVRRQRHKPFAVHQGRKDRIPGAGLAVRQLRTIRIASLSLGGTAVARRHSAARPGTLDRSNTAADVRILGASQTPRFKHMGRGQHS